MAMENISTVCGENQCAGCMACLSECHKNAIKIVDSMSSYNAVIDKGLCVNCGKCTAVCPNIHPVAKSKPHAWYQGWAKNEQIRSAASSGGIASALAIAFILNGGVCCSCLFENGEFVFRFATKTYEVKRFTGSKYVKSNPIGIYQEIRSRIKSGERVLFIGLPCQVAAVRNSVKKENCENLYTVDLICHGTPSPKMLEMFLAERGYIMSRLKGVKFREKTKFYLSGNYKSIEPLSVRDRYTLSFLRSLNYTENCYSCEYAEFSRVSDLTLGDSWGSTLPQEEQDKGVSLILSQSKRGDELLMMAELDLMDVDIELAKENNKQLSHPSKMPEKRTAFFEDLKRGKKFNKTVTKCYPKACMRQDVKALLIRAKILGS